MELQKFYEKLKEVVLLASTPGKKINIEKLTELQQWISSGCTQIKQDINKIPNEEKSEILRNIEHARLNLTMNVSGVVDQESKEILEYIMGKLEGLHTMVNNSERLGTESEVIDQVCEEQDDSSEKLPEWPPKDMGEDHENDDEPFDDGEPFDDDEPLDDDVFGDDYEFYGEPRESFWDKFKNFGGNFKNFWEELVAPYEEDEYEDELEDEYEDELEVEIEVTEEDVKAVFEKVIGEGEGHDEIRKFQIEFCRLCKAAKAKNKVACQKADEKITKIIEGLELNIDDLREFNQLEKLEEEGTLLKLFGTKVEKEEEAVEVTLREYYINKALVLDDKTNTLTKESVEFEKTEEDILRAVERRIKAVKSGMIIDKISNTIMSEVIKDTELLLSSKYKVNLDRLLEIYNGNEKEQEQEAPQTEYVEFAIACMTQRIVEKQEEKGGKEAEPANSELGNVNEKYEKLLNDINDAVEEAKLGNKVEKDFATETTSLLQQGKLTKVQTDKLVECYKKAREQLAEIDKKPDGVPELMDQAEELIAKQNVGNKIAEDTERQIKEKETERRKIEVKIEKNKKIKQQIEQILEKYKSKINKFISEYKKIFKMIEKNGGTKEILEHLSEKMREEERKIEEQYREIERLKEEVIDSEDEKSNNKEIGKCKATIEKSKKKIKSIGKEMKVYTEAFSKMKKIRTEIAEEVCNSKEWMPETGIYMKENAKTNKAFFEVVQGRKIERDLGEESEDVAKYGNINKEIENLKGKNGNREHGSAAQSTQQSNRRTQVNTTQLSDRGTMAGNPTTKENKAKKAEKPKKQNESKKVKEEGFVVDPTNKVKYSLMSEKAKQRRAFEYYRSKFKFFKNVRAFFMSRTEGGRNEWRQHFLAAKESEVTESAAKDFRRQMAEATYQNVMSTGEVVRTADGKIKAVKYKGQEEKVEPEGR